MKIRIQFQLKFYVDYTEVSEKSKCLISISINVD